MVPFWDLDCVVDGLLSSVFSGGVRIDLCVPSDVAPTRRAGDFVPFALRAESSVGGVSDTAGRGAFASFA